MKNMITVKENYFFRVLVRKSILKTYLNLTFVEVYLNISNIYKLFKLIILRKIRLPIKEEDFWRVPLIKSIL